MKNKEELEAMIDKSLEDINTDTLVLDPAEPKKKKGWWKNKTKWQKFAFILGIAIIVISIMAMVVWIYSRQIFGDELGDVLLGYYYSGEEKIYFNNGWQKIGHAMTNSIITWVLTLFIIAAVITLIFISNVLIRLFTNKASHKSQTIASLMRSLVKYVFIIVGAGFILAAWGVDVAGIIAGVGVLTLVIGLGCQSLIQDIVGGLFIVFDDYFSVGDVVIVDGFRGTVVEVGLKTTKFEDAGGNIKSISNSQITTVVNLSRLDSMVLVTIGCAYEEDIMRVEGLIASHMEELRKNIPNITKGPIYKGIDNISASSIDFLVLCYCKEADRYQVTRDIKRELLYLFRNNDVIIPYQQISVNPANDVNRPTANEVETLWATKANNSNRGIGVKKAPKSKKKNIFKKVGDAVKAEANEVKE